VTAEELIARAAACQSCGKEHKPITQGNFTSWASPDDGHPYRSRIQTHIVADLRMLAANPQAAARVSRITADHVNTIRTRP
jgi:hypothetical protein